MSQSLVFNHKKPSSLVKMARVILGVFLLNTLLPPMVIAQIVADPNQSRRPIIHESANGTPQVNIQTPNHNGISMNHYAQFDVDGRGVILNNSRKDTQTQLGGYVQGNPWLATGEANLIVNQVNSANPSHLNGYIEIAGKRADLIIANPSGLNIDGAGFINANRAVLTTGDLLFEGGRLNGFSVQQGEINISGKGLDARDTNFTQILTSAANINAGIWGQDLKIVTGHFESDYEGSSIKGQAYQYSEDISVYAIDTKNLGGMYAGQITLVSTDRDRHINIEGEVFANAGGVVINADGTISNSGVINSNQETANITINAKKVENSGTISSQHHQKISAKEIINSGLMAARGELSVKAKYLTVNQGAMNAGRIDITADKLANKGGKIVQTGSQTLAINSDSFTNINNALVGSVPLDLGIGNGDNSTNPGSERPDPIDTDPIPGGDGKQGSVAMAPPLPPLTLADGAINVKNIVNDNGVLTGNGDIHLTAKESLVNDGSAMHIGNLRLEGSDFTNKNGVLNVVSLSADVDHFVNDAGKLQVQKTIDFNIEELENINKGTIVAGDQISIAAKNVVNEGNSTLASDGAIILRTEALKNYDSEIFAKGLEIKAKDVDNKSGTLTSLEKLSIKANNLDNRQGKIQANQGIALSIQDELDNSAGIIATGENLQLTATTLDNQKGIFNVGNAAIQVAQLYNQEGEIGAHEKLVITANSLDNNQGKVLAESADLKIENIDNRQKGALLASKALQIVGIQLNNETGVMSADDINLTIENINNQQGEMSAEKALVLTGKMLDNRDGLIASNQNLTIHNDSTQNQSGKILAGGDNTLNIQGLNNQQGLIEGHNLLITGDHLDNIEGKIHGNNQVILTLDKTLHNQKGEITSAKDLTITSSNATSELVINIEESEILAGNDLVINAQELSGKGTLAAGQDLTVTLIEDLNTSSTIQAGRDLLIDTDGNFVNSGEITSLGSATIHAGDIKNTEEGSIEANQKVVLTSQKDLENRGLINSNGLTHLDVQGAIYNIATGKIYGDLIAINAKELHNTYEAIDGKKVSGSIAAREQLNIGVDYLLNEEGALLFSGNKLVIGGELDDNFNVVSNAGLVENKSATIESLGDMYLGADKLVNSNEHFRFEKVEVGERTGLVYIKPFGESERYDVGHFRWEAWEEAGRYRWATSKPVTEAGIPGKTVLVEVGGLYCVDMADPETCSPIEGSDYLADNPAWTYFKLTPPSLRPTFEDFGLPEELAILPPIKPEAPEQGCDENPIVCDFYKKDLEIYEKDLALYNEILTEHEELFATYQEEYNLFVTSMVTWYEQSEDLYAQLDDAIYEYNQKIAGKNWGEVRDFTQYNLKETYFEDQIVESDGGKIIAGGNLMLNGGEFINDKSIILVGGDILGDIDRLKNIDQKGHYVTQETGSIFLSTTYKYKKIPSYRNVHRRNHRYAGEHFDEKIEEIDLKAYTVETNTLVQSENAGSVGNVSNIFVTNAGNSGFTDHDLADTNNQNDQYHNDQNLVIANVDVNTDLPSSSIYSINPNSQDYLIETDSKFTNYKNWLGSDYLLNRMGMNGDLTLKRLGDGFYEQRLVNDQIAQLTGRRFLEGYANDEAQFKALMENGATFATGLGIAPGVKLSADQVARLTSDIVWLETETVTLADGSRVDVLVPKVYLMIDQNSINQSGTLIAGDSINLNMSGELVNQGTIAGRDITSLKANNIENISGTISGNRVGLTAKENISIAGGSVLADSQLALNAGKDVTIESTTYETNSGNNSRTGIKREAALYVKNPDGTLSVQAGNDITLKAANIENAGENGKTQLLAGGNINIGTITESESATFVADAKNYDHTARTKDIGSTISAKGDLLIKADDQVNIIGSDLHSDSGTVAISGDKGVNISEGRETLDSSGSRYEKSSGSFSSQSREINFTDKNDTSISSNVTGQNVVIVTKDDLNIQGSNVVADENVTLVADKNINIAASEDHYYHDEEEIIKKSGLMGGGGFGFSVGKKARKTYDENKSLIHNGSMVGSLGGNVTIKAGENYTQEGSHVSAAIGDVNITAESVDIKAAEDSYSSYHREKFKQSGLTISLGGSIVDAVNQIQSVQESIKDVGKSKNDRVNAMAAANAAMDLKRLGDSMGAAQDLLSNGMASDQTVAKITATIGSSQSQSETWREDKVASGSAIQAGGNVNITATGGGEDSNITIEGSYVGGGKSTNLTADNDINILAGENKSTEDSRNSSSGWNAGVVASIGKETGFGVTAGANKGKGKSEGNETYYTNSVVGTDTGKTTIVSGGNTNIIGGEVYGKGVELDVGGDLTIASTQDRSDYHSEQKDSSVQGTWMLGGGGSLSGSHSQSKINANHQSVTDQSGIFAGDDGFQVKVEGNTHLSGGVVVANDKAEKEGLNSFETGTITSNDLVNQSEYDGEGFGISGGYGYQNDGPNNPKGTNPTQTETVNLPDGSHSVNKNVGYGKDKDSKSSVTQSGIGTSNITVTDNDKQQELTGQTAEEAAQSAITDITTETVADNSGAIENIFDKEKVQAEIDLQVKVRQQFDRTRQDMKQIVNQKIDQYKDSDPDKAKDWQNAGLVLDMLAGGLSSPGDGFLGSLAGAANPAVAQMIKGMVNDGTLEEGGLSHILAHGIAGAAMAAANGGDLLSGALTAGGAEALAPIIAEFLYGKGKTPEDLTADEKNTLSAIIGILGTGAGALTGDSTIDAVIGDSVATNAVENNYNLLISKNDQWLQAQERDAAVAIFDGDEEKADLYLEGRREGELTGRKESGADLVDSLLHPIDTLVDSAVGIWEVATDPKGTYDQVVISYNDWEELLAYAMENDPKAAGEMLGIVAGNVEFNAGLTMLTMGGGAAISSSGKLGQLLQKLAKDKQSSSSSSSSLSSSSGNSNQSNSGFGKPEQTSDNKTNASKKGNNHIEILDAEEVRFSQNTVSYNKINRETGKPYTYDDLVSSMKKEGWVGDPIDVVKMPDGKFTSMDNTRIKAAREAGIAIKANARNFDDKLSSEEITRFSDPRKGFVPQTWGEAIKGRIDKQSGGFGKNNPHGSIDPPRTMGKPEN